MDLGLSRGSSNCDPRLGCVHAATYRHGTRRDYLASQARPAREKSTDHGLYSVQTGGVVAVRDPHAAERQTEAGNRRLAWHKSHGAPLSRMWTAWSVLARRNPGPGHFRPDKQDDSSGHDGTTGSSNLYQLRERE